MKTRVTPSYFIDDDYRWLSAHCTGQIISLGIHIGF